MAIFRNGEALRASNGNSVRTRKCPGRWLALVAAVMLSLSTNANVAQAQDATLTINVTVNTPVDYTDLSFGVFAGFGNPLFNVLVSTSGGTGTSGPVTIPAGTFTILNNAFAAGLEASPTYSCSITNGVPGTVTPINNATTWTVDPGANIVCNFEWDPRTGTLFVVKQTQGGDGTFDFVRVTNNAQSGNTTTITPQVTTSGGQGGFVAVSSVFAQETYAVFEAPHPDFILTDISCSSTAPGAAANPFTIDLANRFAVATTNTLAGGSGTCTFTNRRPHGNLTIIKRSEGSDGTFSFAGTGAAPAVTTITTSNGMGSASLILDAGAPFTITENRVDGFVSSDLSCTGGANVTANAQSGEISGSIADGENVTCTFTNTEVRRRTQGIIRDFIDKRADIIVSNSGPNSARIQSRLSRPAQSPANAGGSVKDDGWTPMKLGGSGTESGGRMNFSGSLVEAHGYNARFDAWVSGSLTYWNNEEGQSHGHLGLLSAGIDYIVQPGVLLGVMTQHDSADLSSNALGYDVKGRGWMVGPYTGLRLSEHLFFDARALWGQSSNDISPFQTYTDAFDTDRWLAAARLSGRFQHERWTFTPSAEIIHFEETSDTYVDSNGFVIPEVTVELTRAAFGPEISYAFIARDETVVTPRIGIKGLWDFKESNVVGLSGAGLEDDTFRARLEGGLSLQSLSGMRLDFSGHYDGIGRDNDIEAYGGRVKLSVPLN